MQHQVSAILLAAGSSRRMGKPKQLLPLGEKTVIGHCVATLLSSGIRDVVVVTGAYAEEIKGALGGFPVRIAHNAGKDSEMADSIRVGLKENSPSASAVLVCLSDHPLVRPETVRMLLQVHEADPARIVVPVYNGKNGHPTLLPWTVIQEIILSETLRAVIRKDPLRVHAVEVADEGVVLDMDTPDDYERIRKLSTISKCSDGDVV